MNSLAYKLKRGDGNYPLTAERASRVIVECLLADLPVERRQHISSVIEDWASERESRVAGTTWESCSG